MFKNRARSLAVYSLVAAFYSLIHTTTAFAAVPYPASNVLGQTTGWSPDFTTSWVDNIATPNAWGLDNPYGIAVDPTAHYMFVADSSNNRVIVHTLNASNTLIDRTPDFVLGQANFTTKTAGLSATGMNNPRGLALDSTNTLLYVADGNNNRILVFDYGTSLTNNMAAVNVLGQTSFTANTSSVTQSTFSNVRHLELNSSGTQLYVSDASRVLLFDVTGITDGEAAVNVLGDANFTGTGTGNSQAELSAPTGIALDETGNRLFVADGVYDRILVFDSTTITNGETAVNVLGKANYTQTISSPAATASTLDGPQGLHYDSGRDYLYVTTPSHYRMVAYDVAAITNGENAVHVLGQSDYTSTGFALPWRARISWPYDVTQVGNTLYVAAQHDYKVALFDIATFTDGEEAFDEAGQTDSNGNYPTEGTGANNPYNNIDGLDLPYTTEVDSVHHRLFVGDSDNNRVLVYNLDNNDNLLDRTPDALLGQTDFNAYSGHDLTQNNISGVQGLSYDPERNWLFVADTFYGRVMVFDVATVSGGENALYVLGQADFTTSDTSTCDQAKLAYPIDLEYDTERKLLFVNDWNCSATRIMVYDVNSITNGENAAYVLGQPDFTSGNSTADAATMELPYGLAYDPQTKWLFIGDSSAGRVVVYDTTTLSNGMNASYVLGAANLMSTGNGTGSQTALEGPTYVTIDGQRRRLYVLDGYSRIMIYDINTLTNNEPAVGLLLQDDFVAGTNTYGVSQTMLQGDGAMSFSSGGNILYAADPYSQRVMQFSFIRLTSSTLSGGFQDNPYSLQLSHTASQGTVSYALTSGSLPSGLTLSTSGLLSGTPTVKGSFPIQVTVSDNNAVAGTFTDTKSFTLTIAGPDVDTDGVEDSVEDAGPNSGDANGDGTADSGQTNVSSNINSVTSGYTAVQSSTGNIESFTILSESSLPTQNDLIDFPVGLNSFSVSGVTPGSSTNVTVYYDRLYDTSAWKFMKYSTSKNTYTDMSTVVTYGTQNVGGTTVTIATYTLTDGGIYDEDGVANGTIVDPAGPALITGTLSETGTPATLHILAGSFVCLFTIMLSLRTARSNSSKL